MLLPQVQTSGPRLCFGEAWAGGGWSGTNYWGIRIVDGVNHGQFMPIQGMTDFDLSDFVVLFIFSLNLLTPRHEILTCFKTLIPATCWLWDEDSLNHWGAPGFAGRWLGPSPFEVWVVRNCFC